MLEKRISRRELLLVATGLVFGCSTSRDIKKAPLENNINTEGPPLDICLEWPTRGPISSYMGPAHPLGIDIDKFENPKDPVAAAADGKVIFAGGNPDVSYGFYAVVEHNQGIFTLYAHLSKITAKMGDQVTIGETLGIVGCTGYCTGPHLHFELRKLKDPRSEYDILRKISKNLLEVRHFDNSFYFYNPLSYLNSNSKSGECIHD